MRLLIIEDQVALATLMKQRLEEYGYACDVAYNGCEGEWKGSITLYDAILLDLNMPDMDGFEVLKSWRTQNIETPVLIVSARNEVAQRIQGLSLGSDDYIVKPFEFDELHARIQAVIRRYHGRVNPEITIGHLTIHPSTRQVYIDETMILLSAKEFDILEYIALKHPHFVSSEEIVDHVYNEAYDPFSSVIRVHLANIRKKLMVQGTSLLQNSKGKGYYLCE